MIIGTIKEISDNERRVAITPETCKKFISLGYEVLLEKDSGKQSNYSDEEYIKAGAVVINSITELLPKVDILLTVSSILENDYLELLKDNAIFIGMFNPYESFKSLSKIVQKKFSLITLDFLPRISRAQAMDVLSSQANLAGYKAVIEASSIYRKAFPMMMTAAGTIVPAKCLILGAGVAGLQAIATAKRLGCIVSAFDVRPEVEEQVNSLGATFVKVQDISSDNNQKDSVYAKEMTQEYKLKQYEKIHEVAIQSDIIITTALIPGKKAPLLIRRNTIKEMKGGSVIIDMSGINGGNVEGMEFDKKIVYENINIYAPANIPSLISADASLLYSKNIFNFIETFTTDNNFDIEVDDELVTDSIIIKNGTKTDNFFEVK